VAHTKEQTNALTYRITFWRLEGETELGRVRQILEDHI